MTCHYAKEIKPSLYIGSIGNLQYFSQMGCVNVFILTEDLPDVYWPVGFKTLHRPIRDGGILPDEELGKLVEEICASINSGKTAICCASGHGRTGYVAACVLARYYNVENPVDYLREYYCIWTVENRIQINAVERYVQSIKE